MFLAFCNRYFADHGPFLGLAAAGLICVGASATARATLVITLTNGASTVTVSDNEITPNADSNPAAGQILYSGSVGAFMTTITVASSNSPGTPAQSKLSVTSINGYNTAGSQQTLVVTISDVGFTQPNGPVALQSTYSGSFNYAQAGDSTSFQSFVDPSNTAFGEPVSPSTLQSFALASSPLQSISDTSAPFLFSVPGPYSLTDLTTITVAAGATWQISGITSVTPLSGDTPEPASLGLLAPAVVALLARRRARQA